MENNDNIVMSRIAFERMQSMDMSVRAIKNIVYKAEAKLFKHI